MLLSPKLAQMLGHELTASNSVDGEYKNQFANCKNLVILKKPFQVRHSPPVGVEEFINRDSHYPLGRGYKDNDFEEILLAPLS
jgi:hypothetical protein